MRNRYRVPATQWVKWSAAARRMFTELFGCMHRNQWVFLHPHQAALSSAMWRTVAWNAAWLAADAVDGTLGLTTDFVLQPDAHATQTRAGRRRVAG